MHVRSAPASNPDMMSERRRAAALRGTLASSAIAAAFLLTACTATADVSGASPDNSEPSTTPAEAAPSLAPSEGPLDPASLGEHCLDQFNPDEAGLGDSMTESSTAAVRTDGLIFVTVPTQMRALSGDGEVFLDADLYCYFEPRTLATYTSTLGYEAVGVTVNLETEYDLLFEVREPIDGLLD